MIISKDKQGNWTPTASGTLYFRQAINPSSMPPTSSDWTTWKTIVTN